MSKSWGDPAGACSAEEASRLQGRIGYGKSGLWDFSLFFPAESEAPGTKNNSQF
jgi:hypothetical protein